MPQLQSKSSNAPWQTQEVGDLLIVKMGVAPWIGESAAEFAVVVPTWLEHPCQQIIFDFQGATISDPMVIALLAQAIEPLSKGGKSMQSIQIEESLAAMIEQFGLTSVFTPSTEVNRTEVSWEFFRKALDQAVENLAHGQIGLQVSECSEVERPPLGFTSYGARLPFGYKEVSSKGVGSMRIDLIVGPEAFRLIQGGLSRKYSNSHSVPSVSVPELLNIAFGHVRGLVSTDGTLHEFDCGVPQGVVDPAELSHLSFDQVRTERWVRYRLQPEESGKQAWIYFCISSLS